MRSLERHLRAIRSRLGLSSENQSAADPPSDTHTHSGFPPISHRWVQSTEKSTDIIVAPRLHALAAIYGFSMGELLQLLYGSEED